MEIQFADLMDRWDAKTEQADNRRFLIRYSRSDAEDFSDLMVETYAALKEEWEKETVSRDCCRMLMRFAQFGVSAWDEDGNCLGNELFEAASWIHYGLRMPIMKKGKLPETDEDGMLVLEDLNGWRVDPDRFDIPEDTEAFFDQVFG